MKWRRCLNIWFFWMSILFGLLVVLWGCPGPGPVTRGDPVGPKQHLWKPLIAMLSEDTGYGMYTYVLFGRKLKPMGRLGSEALERYERLLEAIGGSTLSVSEGGQVDKAGTNVFMIPLTAEVAEPTRNSYNGVLSLRYISLLSAMVRDVSPGLSTRLASGEGPFLISTPEPVGEIEKERIVLLYAELSSANPAAMDEIVGAYKRRVGKGIRAIERFRSLRLALLDLILDADDNIKIVRTALASE